MEEPAPADGVDDLGGAGAGELEEAGGAGVDVLLFLPEIGVEDFADGDLMAGRVVTRGEEAAMCVCVCVCVCVWQR